MRSAAGETLRAMWSMRFYDYTPSSLALFLVLYFVGSVWTSGLAIPAGAFTPSMLNGAVAGRLFAHVLCAAGIVEKPDGPLYGLLGSAAFFAGVQRVGFVLAAEGLYSAGPEWLVRAGEHARTCTLAMLGAMSCRCIFHSCIQVAHAWL